MLSYWWEYCFIILGGRCLPGRKSLWPAEKNGIHIASDSWGSSIVCLQQLPFLKCGSPMLMCVSCAAASDHDGAHSPCCWQESCEWSYGLCHHQRPRDWPWSVRPPEALLMSVICAAAEGLERVNGVYYGWGLSWCPWSVLQPETMLRFMAHTVPETTWKPIILHSKEQRCIFLQWYQWL